MLLIHVNFNPEIAPRLRNANWPEQRRSQCNSSVSCLSSWFDTTRHGSIGGCRRNAGPSTANACWGEHSTLGMTIFSSAWNDNFMEGSPGCSRCAVYFAAHLGNSCILLRG